MENIIKRYEKCFSSCAELPALTDCLSGKTYSYLQLAARVEDVHRLLKESGIVKGDHIAIIGKNSIGWISIYIGIVTYGAAVVPILADFNPKDMVGIVTHSDSRILFADRAILDKIGPSCPGTVEKTFAIEDFAEPSTEGFDINAIRYADVDDEDVMIVSYTSGTTGSSKGVMLPVRSITNNVQFALDHNFHFRESRVLALLPLAHAYGCAFDMLTPLAVGAHVHVLGKIPSPRVLLDALSKVKPHLVCTVPLVMEKLVRKNITPQLQKQPVRFLRHVPLVNLLIYKKIKDALYNAFGGCLKEVNMGGAALAGDVEKILRTIHFPFTIGYGMTETGPLISYARWQDFKPGSCGTVLPGMEVRIETEGYEDGVGEVCVRGVNVMKGYYKNPEATSQAIRDGWLHTGDVGTVDPHGTIFLKGRCKSMILTSAGQNIYPEEIESKLNNLPGVGESLAYEEGGKIIALVVPDPEFVKQCNGDFDTVQARMQENLTILNTLVAPYEKVSAIRLCNEAFEKTPKQSIKRFLYPKIAKLWKKTA